MYSRTEELQVGKDAFNPTVPFDVGAPSISMVVALRCVVGIGIRVPVMDALRVRRGKTKLKNSIVEHVIVKLYTCTCTDLHICLRTTPLCTTLVVAKAIRLASGFSQRLISDQSQ